MHVNKQLISWIALYCLLALVVLALVRYREGDSGKHEITEQWRVENVVDGDTVVVAFSRTNHMTLRLSGIDAPERGQAHYREAKSYLKGLLVCGRISVSTNGIDRYNRAIATVYVNGTNVNRAMIEAGMAWHYKQYSQDSVMTESEQLARQRRVGLWSDPSPIPPWDYRRSGRIRP